MSNYFVNIGGNFVDAESVSAIIDGEKATNVAPVNSLGVEQKCKSVIILRNGTALASSISAVNLKENIVKVMERTHRERVEEAAEGVTKRLINRRCCDEEECEETGDATPNGREYAYYIVCPPKKTCDECEEAIRDNCYCGKLYTPFYVGVRTALPDYNIEECQRIALGTLKHSVSYVKDNECLSRFLNAIEEEAMKYRSDGENAVNKIIEAIKQRFPLEAEEANG